MGFCSAPGEWIPYSVSIPHTLMVATPRPYRSLEVLTGTHSLNRPTTMYLAVLGEQGTDINDALALLSRNARPVVGIGGVGQVFVLLVLLADRLEQVRGADAAGGAGDDPLDGQLLGPPDDVLDHGARGEVAVVEDLLVAVLVGDLEEAVLVILAVHLGHRVLDDG